MNARQIIKEIMNTKGIVNADMAHRLSITQAALWDRLNTKKTRDIPVSTLCEMLAVMDYDVVIVPRGKGSKIEGAYRVGGAKQEAKYDLDSLLGMKDNKLKAENQIIAEEDETKQV